MPMSQIGIHTRNIFVSMVTNYLTKKGGEEKQQILVTQLKLRSGHKSDGKTCGT